VRPPGNIFRNENRAPLIRFVRLEPPEGREDQAVVPGPGLVQGVQGERDGQRLAAGTAAVGLQGVAEATVGVAVGGDRVAHIIGPAVLEQPLEPPPVQHPATDREELGGGAHVHVR